MIADLWRDLRYAVRRLRQAPAFTVMVVFALALGIGANVAIFTLVNAVLLRPLPVEEPGRLVLFSDGSAVGRRLGAPPAADGRIVLFSQPLYERLRDGAAEGRFELAAQDSNLVRSIVRGHAPADGSAEDAASGRGVTGNFFTLLRVPAYRGRLFAAGDESAPGANPVVVLSHRFWERRFGSDPQLIGERININGADYTVIGITPPGFAGATMSTHTDFWVPLSMADAFTRGGMDAKNPDYSWLQLFGRLEPGASMASAEANLNVSLARFMTEDTSRSRGGQRRIGLEEGSVGFSQMRQNFREPLLVLMTGVGLLLLLLIVCLNVSHLLLARAMNRQQEMSIRTALGATRLRLVRQLLTEGLSLAALGALAGAFATRWLTQGLLSLADFGQADGLSVEADARVLGFSAILSLGTALLLGLVPAWHAWRTDLQQALRANSQTVTLGGARRRISRVLLVSQVAFSLVLLVAAGLLSSSLGKLRDVPTGFDEEHVLMAELNLQMAGLSEERTHYLYEEIPRRIAGLPGVRAASLSEPDILMGGGMRWSISFPGTALDPKGFNFYLVTPGYFDAMGMRLLRGRGFSSTDSHDGPRVAVVNETMAQRTREIGVRMALGATAGGVQWMVLRQAFRLVLVGLGLGVPAALGVAQLLQGFLFEVKPLDPAALLGAALALLCVATLAAYLPARRASRVDPVTALRCE